MAKWGNPPIRRTTLITSVPPPPPSSAPMPPTSELIESSGIRLALSRKCEGPAWLKEESHRFNSCSYEFVCDDPRCKEHSWTQEDRTTLFSLKLEKEDLKNEHEHMLVEHGPRSRDPNPRKCKESLGAFLRANSRLYTFVVRKAVERSRLSPSRNE
jgi:hypothetical protein